MIQGDMRSNRGFTTVELVLAVVVIGIIVAVTSIYIDKRQRARLTGLATTTPREVFTATATATILEKKETDEYLLEAVVTVTNPTPYPLPMQYSDTSFYISDRWVVLPAGAFYIMSIDQGPGEPVSENPSSYVTVVDPRSSVDFRLQGFLANGKTDDVTDGRFGIMLRVNSNTNANWDGLTHVSGLDFGNVISARIQE